MLKDGTQTATAGIGFYAGTVSLPGIYMGTETSTGFYRIGANNTGYAVSGSKVLDIASTGLGLTGAFTATTGIKVTGAGSLGYATGSGGTVTQLTDKSTGVTLNKATGSITMNNATLNAGAKVSFTLTNSTIATTDTVVLTLNGAPITGNSYRVWVDYVDAGGICVIVLENYSGSNLSQAVVINFAVIKAVIS